MNVRTVVLIMCFAAGMAGICLGGPVAAATNSLISDAEALAKFTAATEAYKLEHYDQAIAAYEEILRGGKESGALYYNLGNSYFKEGKLGKAILNYERARRLIPRDGDLNFNLEYARSKANLSATPAAVWPELVEPRIRNWSDREIAWALVVIALAAAGLHLASLFGRWPVRVRRAAIGVTCALLLIFTGGLAAKLSAGTDLAVAVVGTEAKFEPRQDATTHFRVAEGAQAKVLEVENSWAKIRREDGKVGWVPEKVFERF